MLCRRLRGCLEAPVRGGRDTHAGRFGDSGERFLRRSQACCQEGWREPKPFAPAAL